MHYLNLLIVLTTSLTVGVHGVPLNKQHYVREVHHNRNDTAPSLFARTGGERQRKVPTGRAVIRIRDKTPVATIVAELHKASVQGYVDEEDTHISIIPIFPMDFGDDHSKWPAMRAKLHQVADQPAFKNRITVTDEYYVGFDVAKDQRNAPWGVSRIGSTTTIAPNSNQHYDFKYDETAGECADIYIVDTGVYIDNKDFDAPDSTPQNRKKRVKHGKTFVSKKERTAHGDQDIVGHGTMVASIAGGNQFGIAKKSHMISVKVGNADVGRGADVIKGLDWVLKEHHDKQKKGNTRPTLVNLSLGTDEPCPLTDASALSLVEAGIYVVAAAGNFGKDASTVSPARVPQVVTVGASNIDDKMWSKSGFGKLVDIFAPGEKIPAAGLGKPGATTQDKPSSGTSLATPHITGLLAHELCRAQGRLTAHPRDAGNALRQIAVAANNGKMKGPLPADTIDLIAHMPPPSK
ncbi:hypothetical protein CVT24_007325 [Panaeolus cyanescens]|uniref:Peptidase S8/S53 domain-containing protein n=1 Tax=Panaeolus cyanescens TaxID=181874 RepID=A0A409W5B6_9AGAR|nr:hypothetical protein CVT24_007325 [Panaeolus cyanescens]